MCDTFPARKPKVTPARKPKVTTRSSTNVWLIGHPISNFDTEHYNQLPTIGETLCRLFFDLKNKLSLSESCSNTINEVYQLWQIANIPTTQKPNAVAKLKKIYQEYVRVGKNRTRRTERQSELEKEFICQLENLFDISHANSRNLIKIPEDWVFLQDQIKARKMIMFGEDKIFAQREQRKQKRMCENRQRQEQAKKLASTSLEKHFTSTFDSEEEDASLFDDFIGENEPEVEISKYHLNLIENKVDFCTEEPRTSNTAKENWKIKHKLSKRRIIDDPLFISSLDRTKTTPREAMHIVAPALKAAGVDLDDLTLSTSSLYNSRKGTRKKIGENFKNAFNPSTPLVAHFDSKLLPHKNGEFSDRMPVVVSGKGIEKLLGIPKIPSGTGLEMGNAIVKLLTEWHGVRDFLTGLCFDTTSVNTGIHTGAITVVQNAFNKRLLFLACRHHILEIIASAVFDLFFTSSGPQIAIFGRFKDYWPFINLANYAPIDKDTEGCVLTEVERNWLQLNRSVIVAFLYELLERNIQPRDDYLEFIKLALITLGENPSQFLKGKSKVIFSPPGAYHRARWMAKGIYCLKIFCFREQFKLTKYELCALKRICLFIVTIYVKAWFSATSSCSAPYNDLCLLKTLELFEKNDSELAKKALVKLKGQLWYLSEDLIGLSLFSDHVPMKEKRAIISALQKPEKKIDSRRLNATKIGNFQNKTLSDFATKRSLNLFTALKIDCTFLKHNIDSWVDRDDYNIVKEKLFSLRVVNDCAERAVKLASDFNNVLVQDEDQRQLLYQTVEYHRHLITRPMKKHFKINAP